MNLKQAARLIGVHYQTAYKWVRAGDLVAVRIGTRYEVSEASVDQFLANRRTVVGQADIATHAHRRATDVHPEDFLEELEFMGCDPVLTVPAIEAFAARRGTQLLGDTCIVAVQSADRGDRTVLADHPRADHAAFYNSIFGLSGRPFLTGEGLIGTTLKQGEPLLLPTVDQTALRRSLRPELRQYLSSYPVYSLVGAPVFVEERRRGMVVFLRITPKQPYSHDDERFARRIAARLGPLVLTADEIDEAWALRRVLKDVAVDALRRRRPGLPFTGAELQDLLYGPGRPGAESRLPSIALSPDDRILAVNPAAARFFGYTPRELQGRRRDEVLLPPESLATETEAHAQLHSGEVDFHDSHARRVRSDGTAVDVAVHRAAVREVDSNLACIVGVARPLHTAVAEGDDSDTTAMSAAQRD